MRQWGMFHHMHMRTDIDQQAIEDAAQKVYPNSFAARQGQHFELFGLPSGAEDSASVDTLGLGQLRAISCSGGVQRATPLSSSISTSFAVNAQVASSCTRWCVSRP